MFGGVLSKRLVKSLCEILILVSISSFAFSGERGYRIVFYDLSVNGFHNSQFYNYRESFGGREKDKCWNKRSGGGIDVAYYKKPVRGIDRALAKEVVDGSSQRSLKILRERLRGYKDDLVSQGFDGVIIINESGNRIYAYGPVSGATSVPYSKSTSMQGFDYLICKVSAAFDAGYQP